VSAIGVSLTDRSDGYLIRTGSSITEHGVLRVWFTNDLLLLLGNIAREMLLTMQVEVVVDY
jgi:hypothetical protein